MLLIGSQALILRGLDTGRKPLDYDLIGTFDELSLLTMLLRRSDHKLTSIPLSSNKTVLKRSDGLIVEFEFAWNDSTAESLLKEGCVWAPNAYDDPILRYNNGLSPVNVQIATVDQLYTLKMSHRYLKNSPHFLKTMRDIRLMRAAGAKVWSADWLKRREDETYWYKHPKLNVEKKDFFGGDGVEYVFDHDSVHRAVAHCIIPGFKDDVVPAYTLYMKDGEQVQTSKKKFFEGVSEKVRLWGVLEEAQVLALERSQIPFRGKVDAKRSFDIALMKVCTSITSGWFREFAWENYEKVQALYEPDYVTRFWKAVDDGIVRKLEPDEIRPY